MDLVSICDTCPKYEFLLFRNVYTNPFPKAINCIFQAFEIVKYLKRYDEALIFFLNASGRIGEDVKTYYNDIADDETKKTMSEAILKRVYIANNKPQASKLYV